MRLTWLVLTAALAGQGCTCGADAEAEPAAGLEMSREELLAMDQEIDAVLQTQPNAEARTWLGRPNTAFYNEMSVDIRSVVDGFYSAGASRVLVDGIETLGGQEVSASIVVVLPTEASGRARVFQYASQSAESLEDTPPTDVGQRYLWYSFD